MAETVRKTRTFLGRREVSYVKNKTRARLSRTTENIAALAERVEHSYGEWIVGPQ